MRLYRMFFSMHLKQMLAYKRNFWFSIVGRLLTSGADLLTLIFLMNRFKSLKGYTISECVMCYAIVLMAFSLAECFFRGFDAFASIVREAHFDRILMRPRNLIFQILCERIEIIQFSRVIMAVLILAVAAGNSSIQWNVGRVLVLILMIMGGTCLFSSLFIIFAGLCFFTLEGLEFMNVLTDGAKEYGKYPVDVYGKRIFRFCTYIVPYALFQYYPLMYLIGKTDNIYYGFLPLLVPLFLIPAIIIWTIGVRKYKSAGS